MELLVVIAIMGGLGLVAFGPISRLKDRYFESQTMAGLQRDAGPLQHKLQSYFWRAMAMATVQSGTSLPSYRIYGNGAIVLDANLGNCNSFSPSLNNSPTVKRQIEILCCSSKMAVSVPTPSRGVMTLTSACMNGLGLSIIERSDAGVQSQVCHPGYFEMNLIPVGVNKTTGQEIYRLDLFANVDERASVLERRGLSSLRWPSMVTLGNTPGSLLTTCY
jgi:hypothetical protein